MEKVKGAKRGKQAIIKINSEIYDKIKVVVDSNKVLYPSIKNFVEKSLAEALKFNKYNIEGLSDFFDPAKHPLNLVVKSDKNYVMCHMCSKFFLKDKLADREIDRVCPNCKSAIAYFAKQMK